MAIKTDNPQLALLRIEVEKKFGAAVQTPYDFVGLASSIEECTHEHISDSTLKRIWGYVKSYPTVAVHTIGQLCSYVGHPDWEDWCGHLAAAGIIESEIVSAPGSIKADSLQAGDRLYISWAPDRECWLEYLGDRRFRAERTVNSKLKAGDCFCCSVFIKGRPLYVDNLVQDGAVFESYAMGMEHGLTDVEKL